MIDARTEFMGKLCAAYSGAEANRILRIYDSVMTKYEITAKCTDIVPANIMRETEETVAMYLASKKVEGQSLGGIQNVAYTLQGFFRTVNKPLKEVNKNDCRAWLSSFEGKKVSERTLDKYREYVTQFFHWCQDEEIISSNPMKTVHKIKYEVPQRKALSKMEMEYLRDAASDDVRNAAMIEFMYSTGCRVAEMCIMEMKDIDWETKTVHLFGKGKKHRDSYLSPRAIITLKKYLATRTDHSEYLFVRGREPYGKLTESAVEQMTKKLGEKAGITKPVSPHVLRHTFATHALQSGMTIEEVSRILGHSQLSTTMIYVEMNDMYIREQHERKVS